MSELYIYTIKDGYINYTEQNYELIPKLYHNEEIYKLRKDHTNRKGNALLRRVLEDIRDKFSQHEHYKDLPYNKLNVYKFLLYNYHQYQTTLEEFNLKIVKFDYIQAHNPHYIIECIEDLIIRESFNNSSNDSDINNFITYLLRAHEKMQYGLYLSFRYADDDEDFIDKIKRANDYEDFFQGEENSYLIYFQKFHIIVEHVKSIKENIIDSANIQNDDILIDFLSNLMDMLYANDGWDYGNYSDTTIRFLLDTNQFIEDIKNYLDTNNGELISQIPLPHNLFKYIYLKKKEQQYAQGYDYSQQYGYPQQSYDYQAKNFKKKYLKYKIKYLKLKSQIINNLK